MTYLGINAETSIEKYEEYNLSDIELLGSQTVYNIESYGAQEEYFKEDKWLSVYVARSVGKSNINDLTIEDYRTIDSLVLPNKGIKYIPDEIGYMTNLKTLDLSGNEIRKIPKTIQYLVGLEEIDLSRNSISVFCEELVKLSESAVNLKKMSISDNELIFNLENISKINPRVVLDISQNPMDNVYGNKQLILNSKLNLVCNKGDKISAIEKEISPHLRFYNTLTGSIERLSSNMNVSITSEDAELIKEGTFSKVGNYNIKVSIKDASLVNGAENKAIVIVNIPITIKDGVADLSDGYSEKLVKVIKVKGILRESEDISSKVIDEIQYGKELRVIGEVGNFYKVNYDANIGFISKAEVEDVKYSLKEVVSKKANVYMLRTVDSPVVASIPKNQLVKVYSKHGEWCTVSYGGKILYMKSSDLADTVTYVGEISVDKAKVRETPSDKSNAMGMMSKGDRVEIYEVMNNGWYKIKYINKVGYLKISEVKVNSEVKLPNSNQGIIDANLNENPSSTIKPATGDKIGEDIALIAISAMGIFVVRDRKDECVES